jgi:cation diffusion facilitator CzcD-associated flavoprotein CzcO
MLARVFVNCSMTTLHWYPRFVKKMNLHLVQGKTVAIIGAGPAGLIACRELLAQGHKPVVYEQNHVVGGQWVYSKDPSAGFGNSSIYDGLITDVTKSQMQLSDFPYDESTKPYHDHKAVLSYVQSFVKHYGLMKHVKLGCQVEKVEVKQGKGVPPAFTVHYRIVSEHKSSSDGTEIKKSSSKPEEQADDQILKSETFQALVVANGHYSLPSVAAIPNMTETGCTVLHSHFYRNPADFAGKRCLVVGCSVSG